MLQTITQTLTGGGDRSGTTSRPTQTDTTAGQQQQQQQQQQRHHSATPPLSPTQQHQQSSTSTNAASRSQAPSLASGAAAFSLAATTSPKPPAPSSARMSSPSPSAAAGAAASAAHTRRSPSPAMMATKRSAEAVQIEGARWSLMGAVGAHEKRARSVSSPQPVAPGAVGTARRGSTCISQTPEPATPSTAAEDRRKTDILSAATISMAKRTPSTKGTLPPQTDRTERPRYPHLEDAARRIAEERLARIGYTPEHHNSRRRFPLRSHSLTKSRSEVRAEQIDVEMQGLEGSQKKRGQDALLLMTVARRNVQDRMSAQDRQIAESRGLVSREDWSKAATEIAQRESDTRLEHHGKIDIGGGMYMSQDQIDVIAARNVQPVIDDLHERQAADIEQRRAAAVAAEERRLDKENEKRSAAFLRAQEKETEAELKSAEKLRKKELKQYLKAKESESETMLAPPTPPAEPIPEPELTEVDPIPVTNPTPSDRTPETPSPIATPEPSLYSTPTPTADRTTDHRRLTLAEAVRTTPPTSPPRNTANTTPKRRLSSLGLLRRRPISPPAQPTLEEEPARATFLTKLRRNISTRRRSEPITPVETAPPQVSQPPPQKQGNKLKRIVGLGKSADVEGEQGNGKGFDAGTKGWVAGIQKRDPVETERLRMVSEGGGRASVAGQGQESRFTEEL